MRLRSVLNEIHGLIRLWINYIIIKYNIEMPSNLFREELKLVLNVPPSEHNSSDLSE
jgi:hypothetical protein